MTFSDLPINLFDVVLLVVLLMGLLTGRKHGMSEELMQVLKWITVVVACAFIYQPVGAWLAQASPFSLLTAFMCAYAVAAAVILSLFALCKHQLGGKLIGSDIFGRSE